MRKRQSPAFHRQHGALSPWLPRENAGNFPFAKTLLAGLETPERILCERSRIARFDTTRTNALFLPRGHPGKDTDSLEHVLPALQRGVTLSLTCKATQWVPGRDAASLSPAMHSGSPMFGSERCTSRRSMAKLRHPVYGPAEFVLVARRKRTAIRQSPPGRPVRVPARHERERERWRCSSPSE